ncbi:MAG: transglutaminase family protein [Parachlamydiaceae bacterium]|nr:transglutaminase family protein [Parachlamydiaceae bacterium]
MIKYFLLAFSFWVNLALAIEPIDLKLKTLYNRLDPTSISQHLAYYELYQPHPIAEKALQDAWNLLANSSSQMDGFSQVPFTLAGIQSLTSLVNKPVDQKPLILDDNTLQAFIRLSEKLPHTQLLGHSVWREEEVLNLPLDQIDLARGLLISQYGENRQLIRSYEALMDLMAVQILARLPKKATQEEKIHQINFLIFEEMGFRFPPEAVSIKDIDQYSFLPSVIDSHRGVCLGVSILYLCLAQRLQLPLEMITPPGHIYVRFRDGDKIINIETTARGIHLDSRHYLDVGTCELQQRTILEVIGMTYFNQASVYWQKGNYQEVVKAYEKAKPYMKDDPLLKELLGYALLITEKKDEGEFLLNQIKDHSPSYLIVKNTMCEDYFANKVDAEGLKVLFLRADNDRKSILKKKESVEATLKRCPCFRAGIQQLAMIWIQLHRTGECIETLNRFLELDQTDPEVHFYLAILYAQRRHYPKAWHHLMETEKIVKAKNYEPRVLKDLRRELVMECPAPMENV